MNQVIHFASPRRLWRRCDFSATSQVARVLAPCHERCGLAPMNHLTHDAS